jgi:hypothetical protein
MTQKDAVFSAIIHVLSNNGVEFEVGVTDLATVFTKTLRAEVTNTLAQQFTNNEIELSVEAQSKLNSPTELRAYVSGLISNWLRKDNRLNGGVKISTTTKSKTFLSDPQIKALKQLMSTQTDQAKRSEIQAHIDRRLTELG